MLRQSMASSAVANMLNMPKLKPIAIVTLRKDGFLFQQTGEMLRGDVRGKSPIIDIDEHLDLSAEDESTIGNNDPHSTRALTAIIGHVSFVPVLFKMFLDTANTDTDACSVHFRVSMHPHAVEEFGRMETMMLNNVHRDGHRVFRVKHFSHFDDRRHPVDLLNDISSHACCSYSRGEDPPDATDDVANNYGQKVLTQQITSREIGAKVAQCQSNLNLVQTVIGGLTVRIATAYREPRFVINYPITLETIPSPSNDCPIPSIATYVSHRTDIWPVVDRHYINSLMLVRTGGDRPAEPDPDMPPAMIEYFAKLCVGGPSMAAASPPQQPLLIVPAARTGQPLPPPILARCGHPPTPLLIAGPPPFQDVRHMFQAPPVKQPAVVPPVKQPAVVLQVKQPPSSKQSPVVPVVKQPPSNPQPTSGNAMGVGTRMRAEIMPNVAPTVNATVAPTVVPTVVPTVAQTVAPTDEPYISPYERWVCCMHGRPNRLMDELNRVMIEHRCDETSRMSIVALAQYSVRGLQKAREIVDALVAEDVRIGVWKPSALVAKKVEEARRELNPRDGAAYQGKNARGQHHR